MVSLMDKILNHLRGQAWGKINGAYFFTVREVADAVQAEAHRVEYCIHQLVNNGKVYRDTGRPYLMFMEVGEYQPTIHQQRIHAFVDWLNSKGLTVVDKDGEATPIWELAYDFIGTEMWDLAEQGKYRD